MRFLLLIIVLVVACEATPSLQEGEWNGTLTPMNHPEMQNPISYDVSYSSNKLRIDLISPGNSSIPTQNPRLNQDTLYFAFNEPEEQVLLNCALHRQKPHKFSGRCTDPSGKWARFTMVYSD